MIGGKGGVTPCSGPLVYDLWRENYTANYGKIYNQIGKVISRGRQAEGHLGHIV